MSDSNGRQNALAWFASIVEMIDALRKAESLGGSPAEEDNRDDRLEEARARITESVLSVEVRSGWHMAGGPVDDMDPAEFRILLTTGGPAAQLTGELNEHGEPETCRLEHQDWGTPWTEVSARELADSQSADDPQAMREYLLDFARQFYFGEG